MGIKEYLKEKEIDKKAKQALAGLLATGAILTGATACIKDDPIIKDPIDIVDPNLKTSEEYVSDVEDKIQEKIPDFNFDSLFIADATVGEETSVLISLRDSSTEYFDEDFGVKLIGSSVNLVEKGAKASKIFEYIKNNFSEDEYFDEVKSPNNIYIHLELDDLLEKKDSAQFLNMIYEIYNNAKEVGYQVNGETLREESSSTSELGD